MSVHARAERVFLAGAAASSRGPAGSTDMSVQARLERFFLPGAPASSGGPLRNTLRPDGATPGWTSAGRATAQCRSSAETSARFLLRDQSRTVHREAVLVW